VSAINETFEIVEMLKGWNVDGQDQHQRFFTQPLERWSQPTEDQEFVSGLREL
jgi:hypothetical protein